MASTDLDKPSGGSPDRPTAFVYRGIPVTFNERRLVNLTEMWEASGRPENKEPKDWKRLPQSASFITDLVSCLNVAKSHLWISRRGRHSGGTWAHWQIAMAYAKYLSHEFHRFVNDAFREWAEEKASPDLKLDRAIDGYRRQGRTDAWIERRLRGKAKRVALTHAMADHNCKVRGKDNPFAEGTRSISLQVLGKTPSEIKEAKGLPKSASTRDNLDEYELTRIEFAESEAKRLIQVEAADGNAECVDCCRRAGQAVKLAIDSLSRKTA